MHNSLQVTGDRSILVRTGDELNEFINTDYTIIWDEYYQALMSQKLKVNSDGTVHPVFLAGL